MSICAAEPIRLADDYILETFITEKPHCQYGVDGIVFDPVTDDDKVNTAHKMPAAISVLDVEP